MPWRRAAPTPGPDPNPDPNPDPDPVSPDLLAWAQAVDVSRLSERTVKEAERYLQDHRRMNAIARREVGLRLRSVIEGQVSPPPPATVASLDVIATAVSAWHKHLGIG
jgi:hypothetical protein